MFADLEILLSVTELLERLEVPYVVGGSIASSAYGVYRTTNDADIAADLENGHVSPFCRALSPGFYLDEERVRSAVARRTQFNLIHLKKALKVDIYVLGREPFSGQQLARRFRSRVSGHERGEIYLPSPEDTVLQKLRWFRMGGDSSERQWLDVQGVLKVQRPTIDRDYLRLWAGELRVADLLARAFADAGY